LRPAASRPDFADRLTCREVISIKNLVPNGTE
jgi:hypothetical protein